MNCYESDKAVKLFDLLIAEDSEFDLTRNKVYVATGTDHASLIQVTNDKGIKEWYSTEYFRFYDGETIGL